MFIVERFISNVIKEYGKHPVSTGGGTWYPQACQFLKLKHHIHSFYQKSISERRCNTSRIDGRQFPKDAASLVKKIVLPNLKAGYGINNYHSHIKSLRNLYN